MGEKSVQNKTFKKIQLYRMGHQVKVRVQIRSPEVRAQAAIKYQSISKSHKGQVNGKNRP